ncbi:MAG: hypothetical protein ABI443_03680 [Chthoniobacterales bacterium]
MNQNDCKVEIDTLKTGQIIYWKVEGKVLIDTHAPHSPIGFEAISCLEETREDGDVVHIRGNITRNHHKAAAEILYHIRDNGRRIGITIKHEDIFPTDDPAQEFLWSLPLSLSHRKRIYFCGDHGLEWDTRYFYQFTGVHNFNPSTGLPSGTLVSPPDRNEWRYFCLDQFGPDAFCLWKAESDETSRVVMQEGKNSAPFFQIYDPQGGLTVEYPGLRASAPAALRVDAASGGNVSILLNNTSMSVPLPTRKQADISYEIILTADASEEGIVKTRSNLRKKYPTNPLPDLEHVIYEEKWLTETPYSELKPHYVTGGYPFAKAELHDPDHAHIKISGLPVSSQNKALAYWPDGSIKWLQLTFPVNPAEAIDSCPAPSVSLRTGEGLPIEVSISNTARTSTTKRIEIQEISQDSVQVLNGDLKVMVSTGHQWIQNIYWKGSPLLDASASQPMCYMDYVLNPEGTNTFNRAVTGGQPDRGGLVVEKISVEESGPLRAVIRLEGMTDNKEPARIILRILFLAGQTEIKISHTVEFLFKDPRRTFLTGMGITLPFAKDIPEFSKVQIESKSYDSSQCDEVLSLQTTPVHHRALLINSGLSQTVESPDKSNGWIECRNAKMHVFGMIRNFWQQAPKAVGMSFEKHHLKFEFWPESVEPMDVRRYSNHHHLAQGEAIMKPSDDYVQAQYYPEDPFVGISRSDELLLAFHFQEDAPAPVSMAADFQSPPLLYAGWERYESTAVALTCASAMTSPRAWEAWTNFTNFWLYHRTLHCWYGFWNFGDFRHRFKAGFGWIFSPRDIKAKLDESPSNPDRSISPPVMDYHPPNDWAYDNGRWGWSNTEGLGGLFLQNEYLRHGSRVVYFAAEAMARHARDVVTRHEGKWFGGGTRHGVQHWSDANHEERQTTVTEYRLHYFLSGEGRSRDVNDKLYKGIYSQTPVQTHSHHSARLGGLLFHWEMTGSPEEALAFKKYVDLFLSPEGLYIEPNVIFPGPTMGGEHQGLNGGSMFFHTFGGTHALIEYHQITHDEALKNALIEFADTVVQCPEMRELYMQNRYMEAAGGAGNMFWPVIAFAAVHADEPDSYRMFLEDFIRAHAWRPLYHSVSKNPAHWSGETAWLEGNVSYSLFWNNWAPYITHALGALEIINEEIKREIADKEKNGFPQSMPPVSWQMEYNDIFPDYLGYQQPWNAIL